MSELRNEVEFEADQWIIEEMGKRLKAADKKADSGKRGRGDTEKKAKSRSSGTKTKAKQIASNYRKRGNKVRIVKTADKWRLYER